MTLDLDPNQRLNRQETANLLKRSERTIDLWALQGRLPKPIRLGNRSYWPRNLVEQLARHGGATTATGSE